VSAAAAAWAPLGARAPLPRAAPPGVWPDGGRRAQASLPEPKTKLLAGALQRWGAPEGGSVLLIVDELTERVQLASRNLAKLEVNTVAKLNGYDILRADRIILERSALRHIQVRRAGLHPKHRAGRAGCALPAQRAGARPGSCAPVCRAAGRACRSSTAASAARTRRSLRARRQASPRRPQQRPPRRRPQRPPRRRRPRPPSRLQRRPQRRRGRSRRRAPSVLRGDCGAASCGTSCNTLHLPLRQAGRRHSKATMSKADNPRLYPPSHAQSCSSCPRPESVTGAAS